MSFETTSTNIEGLVVLRTKVTKDHRGFFRRLYCKDALTEIGLDISCINVNTSLTLVKGTIRGLHYQKGEYAETKVVTCLAGTIFDVAVDLRIDSATYGNAYTELLTPGKGNSLRIPRGFAHGFQALSDNAIIHYIVDNRYSRNSESGIRYDDPTVGIKWPLEPTHISGKDLALPFLV